MAGGHPARATALLTAAPLNPWLPDIFKSSATACHVPLPLLKHAAGETAISAQTAHSGQNISPPTCFAASNSGLPARRN